MLFRPPGVTTLHVMYLKKCVGEGYNFTQQLSRVTVTQVSLGDGAQVCWLTSQAARVILFQPVPVVLLPLTNIWQLCAVTIYSIISTHSAATTPICNCLHLIVTFSYITTFFDFHCFFSAVPRMHRHKHVSCSDNAWELYGLHVSVIFCMVCLPVACCLHDCILLIFTSTRPETSSR